MALVKKETKFSNADASEDNFGFTSTMSFRTLETLESWVDDPVVEHASRRIQKIEAQRARGETYDNSPDNEFWRRARADLIRAASFDDVSPENQEMWREARARPAWFPHGQTPAEWHAARQDKWH